MRDSGMRRCGPRRANRLWSMVVAALLACAFAAVAPAPAPANAADFDDPQELAQTLMHAKGAGRFDSISTGVISEIIAPVARGETPAPGCALDLRVFQLLVLVLEAYGTLTISDLARSCPGVAQNPPCPTSYISPHCSTPVRGIDFVRVGEVTLRGGAESIPFLRLLDVIVPTGTLAGQLQCGSRATLNFITLRIDDTCNHIHLALPVNGALRTDRPPAVPTPGVVSKIAIGTPDFNGDGFTDVFRVPGDGILRLLQGNGQGRWLSTVVTGTGWETFARVLAPGDFTGDGKPDLIGITPDGAMRLYRGDGAGGWVDPSGPRIGTSWNQFTQVFSPGDFDGDGAVDLLAIRPDGALRLYAGDGAGGWRTGLGQVIGSGWQVFPTVLGPGDFTGDGADDVLGVTGDGALRLYAGNGTGGWSESAGRVIGRGWDQFITVTSPRDFTGDRFPDLLAVRLDGAMLMYRGDGRGGWLTGQGETIGSGWW